MTIADPTTRSGRCPRRSRLCPGPGGGREAGGSAEPGAPLPGAPQRPPSLFGRPFPSRCREEEAPPASPAARAPEKGPHGARKREQRRRGGSGGQEAGGEERWGPEAAREPRVTRAAAHAWRKDGERGPGRGALKVRGEFGVYRGPRCSMKRRDVSNLGDPLLGSRDPSAKRSQWGGPGGWDPGRAPEAGRNTPSGCRAWRQNWGAADGDGCCQGRRPQSGPTAERLGRGLGAGCAAA